MAPVQRSPLSSRKAWSRGPDGRLQGLVVNLSGAMTRNKSRVTKTRISLPLTDDNPSPKGSNGGEGRRGTAQRSGTTNSSTRSRTTRRNTLPKALSPKNRKKYKTPPMTSKVRKLMMSKASERVASKDDDGVESWRRLRVKSEARSRWQKKRPRVVPFPDPIDMTLWPLSPGEVICEGLESGANPEGEEGTIRGMSLRSKKNKSPGMPLPRNPKCRRRLWKSETSVEDQEKIETNAVTTNAEKQKSSNSNSDSGNEEDISSSRGSAEIKADGEATNPSVESDEGKPASTSEVIDAEEMEELELRLSSSDDEKNTNSGNSNDNQAEEEKPVSPTPSRPTMNRLRGQLNKGQDEEEPIETDEALVPLQVWKVGSSRLTLHGSPKSTSADKTENKKISRFYYQQIGSPEKEEDKGAAGDVGGENEEEEEEDQDDIDFHPDVPLDLSRSEEAVAPVAPAVMSPEALVRRAEMASPIRGPEDMITEVSRVHPLRVRPKRMFKTYPVTMEFTHVIGSGGFSVCDLAVLGSNAVRQLDGKTVVVKRTPKVKCPDGVPQREVAILRLFDADSAENYFLKFFFSLERHDEILMVSEYIEGGNLASFYANNLNNIKPELTRYFLAQLAVAIGVLHQKFHVIHRDIKPENVCLDRYGVVKILDFGLAVEGPTCDLKGGTPRYQSKAMRLGQTHSYEADWYSFGASAFMLLSGCIPPPEHSRDYEMDRTDIAPADQTFILALVFEVLKTIDDVLRHEWFHQVDMLAVLQTRPPPMDTGTLFPYVKEARPKREVQRIEVDLDDLEDGLRQQFPGFTQVGNF